FRPEREYVVDVVLSCFLELEHRIEWTDVAETEIQLEDDPERRRLVMPDVVFRTPEPEWLTERALPQLPLARRDVAREIPEAASPAPVPVLFGARDGALVEDVEGGL